MQIFIMIRRNQMNDNLEYNYSSEIVRGTLQVHEVAEFEDTAEGYRKEQHLKYRKW